MTQKEYLMKQHRWLIKMRKYQDARWLLQFLLKNKLNKKELGNIS